MATFTKRASGRWQAKIRREGWPDQSKTFQTRADAQAWARSVERQMDTRSFVVDDNSAAQMTFAQAAERYKEFALPKQRGKLQTGQMIDRLVRVFGRYSLASITTAQLAEYRDVRLKAVSPQTVVHELGMVSRLYRTASMDWGITLPRGNPVALVRKPAVRNERSRRLSEEEEDLLIESLRECSSIYPQAATVLAMETGARRSELLSLTWANVDLDKRVAQLRGKGGGVTKNGDPYRNVPLTARATNVLRTLNSLPRQDDRVLPISQESLRISFDRAVDRARKDHLIKLLRQTLLDSGMDVPQIDNEIRALVYKKRQPREETVDLMKRLADQDSTLKDFRFHDLRHEATSKLAEKLEMHELMKVTGHKTARMLSRYYHPRAEDLARKLDPDPS